MRKKYVAGNWKMNTGRGQAESLVRGIAAGLPADSGNDERGVDVAVFPPFTVLAAVADAIGDAPITLGAQDLWYEPNGAFTGEISAAQLQDAGCSSVLVGHSERRHVIGETGDQLAKKAGAALAAGLQVIFCVGEQLAERDADQTSTVIERQLSEFQGLDLTPETLTVAYEPVWAIGTGRTATPDQAQEVHRFIRTWFENRYNAAFAASVRILYGGSVKPDNAAALMSEPDVDGALVGGASLKSEDFLGIISAARSAGG